MGGFLGKLPAELAQELFPEPPHGDKSSGFGMEVAGVEVASVGRAVEHRQDRLLSTLTCHRLGSVVLRCREKEERKMGWFPGLCSFLLQIE